MDIHIIVIIVIAIFGLIDIAIFKTKLKCNLNKYKEFVSVIEEFSEKVRTGIDHSNEDVYILQKASSVSKIAEESIYNSPIVELKSAIKHQHQYDFKKFTSLIIANYISQIEVLKQQRKKVNYDYINPFTLFYRGVGLTLRITFGYLIRAIKPDFSFEGNLWKYLNISIALISGILTIIQFVVNI